MIYNKPSKSDQLAYWLFVITISAFMLYIMLIRPLTLPAEQMPFIFVADPAHHAHEQKLQYALLTGGAIVGAMILTPVIIWWTNRQQKPFNALLEDITKASIEDRITHQQYMQLMNMLPLGKTKKEHIALARYKLNKYLGEK